METINIQHPINLKVVKFQLDFIPLTSKSPRIPKKPRKVSIPDFKFQESSRQKQRVIPPPPINKTLHQERDPRVLVEQLLDELYAQRDASGYSFDRSNSTISLASSHSNYEEQTKILDKYYLEQLDVTELKSQVIEWKDRLQETGVRLARCLRTREKYRRRQKRICSTFTAILRQLTGDPAARFSVAPDDDGGYAEWLHAMRLVARLPAGVPQHFRRKLWLTLADQHLASRGVDWPRAARACFRGTALPDDTELGAQIIKDLHRTGCSLFCGAEGRENQAMLRRVLLAYARWNKEVGYCQGFNMLAAIILEVMEKSEEDSLKVMIYLVEAVLPEGYFVEELRGLTADMAAFRDLLRLRLPELAAHMDHLQRLSDCGGAEPPLADVFTMQWFLTLYATWLPRDCLLKVWDLVLLDGNEVLLLTALAIWDLLQDRILGARTADEYYTRMGGGAAAVWAAGDALVARALAYGSQPELPRLRSLHRYRVAPPVAPPSAPPAAPRTSAVQSMKKGLRLFYSEDEGDSSDDGNKLALATLHSRRQERLATGDRLSLDIGALKRQYARLRERQRQAHVILAAACARHAAVGVPTSPTSLTVNNLLLGKSAIVSSRGRRLGAPPGAIPPSRHSKRDRDDATKHRKEGTLSWKEERNKKIISRRDSLTWKDVKKDKGYEIIRKPSIDFEESGDGIIVPEDEANEICASVRSRNSSESSSYSTRSKSSSDTSLCDDKEKDSESETELPEDRDKETEVASSDIVRKCSSSISTLDKNVVLDVSPQSDVTDVRNIPEICLQEPPPCDRNMSITSPKDLIHSRCIVTESHSPTVNTETESFIKDDDSSGLHTSPGLSPRVYDDITTRKPRIISSPIAVADLSPVDIMPCEIDVGGDSFDYYYEKRYGIPSTSNSEPRPLDVIERLTEIPNFVPDIDVTEINVPDFESPLRSPGEESIAVSEDEPPIPLQIDKYFEDSPDFFGARLIVTDSDNFDIASRRASKRISRPPRKPDSLTLQCNNNESLQRDEFERATSLPHKLDENSSKMSNDEIIEKYQLNLEKEDSLKLDEVNIKTSPKDFILRFGRKNSERALQIIQENSQILSRILTKQTQSDKDRDNIALNSSSQVKKEDNSLNDLFKPELALKESTSDSYLGFRRTKIDDNLSEKTDFIRSRPISIDDPLSIDLREIGSLQTKSPSADGIGSRIEHYGWENKLFLAKSDYESLRHERNYKTDDFSNTMSKSFHSATEQITDTTSTGLQQNISDISTIKSSLSKDTDDQRDYRYSLSTKCSEYLSKGSDLLSKIDERTSNAGESAAGTGSAQHTDFSHVVTSSMSFAYEPSAEDESPTGVSHSSDTLCHVTSLDQVSTPMSPRIFPKDTPTVAKEFGDKVRESDDSCSAVTPLAETDNTISSLTYPWSPSSGSYHPFPTRASLRLPKELGVKLGMYPKDANASLPK